jgi:SPP1 gp7 family putative phage head morphogenesis protein
LSARKYLLDVTTRHQVFLQRFAGGESRKAKMALNRLRHDINARLSQEPTDFQRNRLLSVQNDINALYAAFGNVLAESVKLSTMDLVKDEADFAVLTANRVTVVDFALPATDALVAAVIASQMGSGSLLSGKTIDEAIKDFAGKKAKQVNAIITDGIAIGDTTAQIQRKAKVLTGTLQRRELDTLVRTAVNHASSVARKEVYNRNDDLLDGYIWIATLDNKTCTYCGSRDQKVINDINGQFPPPHYNCRCTTVPNVKDELKVEGFSGGGARPAIGENGVQFVKSNKSYGAWLKDQPPEFIDEALGAKRSQLFRSGQISLDKFNDPTGRVYTLDQLRNMNGIAAIES